MVLFFTECCKVKENGWRNTKNYWRESELVGGGGDSYREFAGEANPGTGRRLGPDGQPLKASMYCLRRLAKATTRADAVQERGCAHLGDSACAVGETARAVWLPWRRASAAHRPRDHDSRTLVP